MSKIVEIDLKEDRNRIWPAAIVAAIMLIAIIATYLLLRYKYPMLMGWFIGLLITYIIFYFIALIHIIRSKQFVHIDEYAISFQFSTLKRKHSTISWQTLRSVHVGPAYIRFNKRSSRSRKVSLSWLPYRKVVMIKAEVEKMCFEKGIPLI